MEELHRDLSWEGSRAGRPGPQPGTQEAVPNTSSPVSVQEVTTGKEAGEGATPSAKLHCAPTMRPAPVWPRHGEESSQILHPPPPQRILGNSLQSGPLPTQAAGAGAQRRPQALGRDSEGGKKTF